MTGASSDVGGERRPVADEHRRATIVADLGMAWMWKVGFLFCFFFSNNMKVLSKRKPGASKQTAVIVCLVRVPIGAG